MALLVSERVGQFFVGGHRLEYTEYGSGDRHIVLLHGALFPRSMHQRLARVLAGDGNHVVALDLLGHGRSDRPDDPHCYSMREWAEQVLALLDHLGADQAVVGGSSLGANAALELAVVAPSRVRGLILEMPGLENGVPAITALLGSLLLTARRLPLVVDAVRVATHAVPRGVVPFWVGVGLDALNHRPRALAALLSGGLAGRLAPPSRDRQAIKVPALVVGHRFDPVHPTHDALMVADELRNSTLLMATSPLEWRLGSERLDAAACKLANTAWASRPARRRRSAAR